MSRTEGVCTLCEVGGQRAAVDRGWVHVEVTRWGPDEGDVQFAEAGFCGQAHAVEWLSRPLPASEAARSAVRTTWADRFALGGCFTAVALALAVLVVGLWTIVGLLIDRL